MRISCDALLSLSRALLSRSMALTSSWNPSCSPEHAVPPEAPTPPCPKDVVEMCASWVLAF
jgi:hypothetical protein